LDYQSRPGVCAQKNARDRLIRLAQQPEDGRLGFADETCWSRFERPKLHAWAKADQPLRLIEQVKASADPQAKALARYGLLVHFPDTQPETEQMGLRFVQDGSVRAMSIQFLDWCVTKAQTLDKTGLVLIWDNASWHSSQTVRAWLRAHNQAVKRTGQGVRLLVCPLPIKSPWLNAIQPKSVHAKRRIAQADHTLSAHALIERLCASFNRPLQDH